MRIAQIAPLSESVPPQRYGGTERVVSYLTEELTRRGHQVTLFASGDSETSAELVPACPRALWRAEHDMPDVFNVINLEHVRSRAGDFDVLHFHFDYWHLALMQELRVPYVTTMHGRLDLPDLVPLFETFPRTPLVSISNAQRGPLADLNWQQTVYHGLPADLLSLRDEPGAYLAFIGRTSPEKGLHRAIEIALRAEMPLRISAAVQPANREYFDREIRPLLEHPLIEFVGELGGTDKEAFLQGASALLFPIDWPEPFGLVMIEAMACGTPVIAFRRGSVEEVVADQVSGFIVDDLEEAVDALQRVESLDRRRVREYFESRFTVDRMADAYLDVYQRLIHAAEAAPTPAHNGVRGWEQAPIPAVDFNFGG